MIKKEDLENFNKEIIKIYNLDKIKAPIHLSGSQNEEQEEFLIKFFKNNYNEGDWILGTWRNHYLWLLSGRDPEKLKQQIVEGHSMHVYDDNFFTSAIVGGIAPIAVGIAKGLKLKGDKHKVLCFIGCMASHCGIVKESIEYAEGFDLPVLFIIENNDESVYTCTSEAWGNQSNKTKVIEYAYKKKYKHHGVKLNTEKNTGLF